MIVIPDIMNVSEEGGYKLLADVLAWTPRAIHESYDQARFFLHFSEDRSIWAFILFDVTSWR